MSRQEKQKKKRKTGLIIAIIVIVVVLISAGIGVFLGFQQYQILKNECDKIIAMDTKTEAIDQKIYTTGSYGNIERVMKIYMQEYVDDMNVIRNLFQEEQFSTLLSVTNLSEDGPEFEESLAYLDDLEAKADAAFKDLETMNQTDTIMEPAKSMNFLFKWIYKSLMTRQIQEEFMLNSQEVENVREQVEATLESRKNMIFFLQENGKDWSVDDGKLSFTSDELLEEYNELKEAIQ